MNTLFLCLDEEPEVYAEDVIIANLSPSVDEYDVICFARRHNLTPVHVSPIEITGIKYKMWVYNSFMYRIWILHWLFFILLVLFMI